MCTGGIGDVEPNVPPATVTTTTVPLVSDGEDVWSRGECAGQAYAFANIAVEYNRALAGYLAAANATNIAATQDAYNDMARTTTVLQAGSRWILERCDVYVTSDERAEFESDYP